jgi:hypothetical protein
MFGDAAEGAALQGGNCRFVLKAKWLVRQMRAHYQHHLKHSGGDARAAL